MNKFQKSNNTNILESNLDVVALRWFFVLVFVVMTCSGVFGQNGKVVAEGNVENREQSASVENRNSQMELVKWFMGSKEINQGSKTPGSTKTTTKKQMIESGMTPNRILSRTLLKKAMAYDSSVA
ncbi:hypothetical protein [Flavobacterium silvaticum]|uniref:Uncharacterized protein n=1 Tax=Flavobacterium silvaticum TaxID=1852020 RepID=A0A972FIE2_9FLAO|nr:hypothetical protein [Flavobacterium silvaticum]NMH26521.1 hypothetical protein [Flavobacterium silvaticum]